MKRRKAQGMFIFFAVIMVLFSLFLSSRKSNGGVPEKNPKSQNLIPLHDILQGMDNQNNTVGNTNKDTITTKKINLARIGDHKFVEREDIPRSNIRYNKSKTHYLSRESVFYDLYTKDFAKVARLHSYINVEVGTNDEMQDHGERDIEWSWYDDNRVMGIQYIYRVGEVPSPKSSIENEFPPLSPNRIRVYLVDVNHANTYYELELPRIEKSKTIRIEGISVEGYLSLAAVSPDAYSRPESEKDPEKYRYLGVYQFDE